MPDRVTVKKPPEHKLKVGAQKENFIEFEITANGPSKKLMVQISIPCGAPAADKTYLCDDGKRASRLIPSCGKLKFDPMALKTDSAGWNLATPALPDKGKLNIKISGLNPLRGGAAGIRLKVLESTTVLHEELYTVPIVPATEPTILQFEASSTNVLQHTEVTLTSTTTGATTVELYANNLPVLDPSSDTKEAVTVTEFKHKVEADTNFQLKVWRTKPANNAKPDVEDKITVFSTARKTWYEFDLLTNSLGPDKAGRTYYPTSLLRANDLMGETPGERLYGIFVCRETKQGEVWSSSSGVDDWQYVKDVPEGMEESPGVIHNGVLWLIGGSSVDPLGQASNRVFWLYKSQSGSLAWREWDEDGSARKTAEAPPPRICHACAAFKGKVWIFGGLSEQNKTLDDVWTCSTDPVKNNFAVTWKPAKKPLPTKRCLPVVTVTLESTRIKGVDQSRLWLFGGASHPYNFNETLYDLHWTEDGEDWKEVNLPKESGGGAIQVLAATIFYDDSSGFLHLAGIFRVGGKANRTSDYDLQDVMIVDGWKNGPLTDFGWSAAINLFLIRSVSFAERWIFSPVYQELEAAKNYRARVYITG